jgi:hypothetical protein
MGQPERSAARPVWESLLFLALSLAALAAAFGPALGGRTLLAPLDIYASLGARHAWIGPPADGLPNNHYLVDFYEFELPRRVTAQRALQAGEFPWWDPFTDGGRPLAAEAHGGVTDPVAFALFATLRFELAYNWTQLARVLLLGLGAFALLRHLGHARVPSLGLALALQFAGTFAIFNNPVSLTAAALWYPWLWIAWDRFVASGSRRALAAAAIVTALAFAAGSVQTHAYLVIFAACFVAGQTWHERARFRRACGATVGALVFGALLAAPVLVPQIELYLLSTRTPTLEGLPLTRMLSGLAAVLTAPFPWALGTFRTFDVSKALGETGLGFTLYLGTFGVLLAWLGLRRRVWRPETRVAALLVAAFVVTGCTPLVAALYMRVAVLAVFGVLVLAAEGLRPLWENEATGEERKFLVRAAVIGAVGFGAWSLAVTAFYPRWQGRVEAELLRRDAASPFFEPAPALRRAQAQRFPAEVTAKNPETWLALAGVAVAAWAVAQAGARPRRAGLVAALALNAAPLISFTQRYVTQAPLETWQRVLAGGEEQRTLHTALAGGRRLEDETTRRFERIFPGATAHFLGAHVGNGYFTFPLPDLSAAWARLAPGAPWADVRYTAAGVWRDVRAKDSPGRFQWRDGNTRAVRIVRESLNRITVAVADGPRADLWRTDRWYPGWRLATPALATRVEAGLFLVTDVPTGAQELTFVYEPRGLRAALAVAGLAALGCLALAVWPAKRGS